MKQIVLTVSFYILIINSSNGQFYDRYWISGYDFWHVSGDTTFGGSYIDFVEEPPRIYYDKDHAMNFWGTQAIISDSSGQLLFYTNGMTIHNSEHQIIPGGDTIGFGPYWIEEIVENQIGGMNLIQGSFILPDPGNDPTRYLLIHSKADIKDPVLPEMSDILLTEIELIDGKPSVFIKDQNILHDTLMYGKIAVCRHANGRDWWILVGRKDDNRYYSMLLTPDGVEINTLQAVGDKVLSGVGQSGFAKEGTIYYRYEGLFFGDSAATINIYDFDRCTGLLSNHRWWYQTANSLGGAAASPSGQFLYTTDAINLWQWDLNAGDIQASRTKVAEYDGYVEPGWFGTFFSFMELAPDGRIYIIPPSGSSMIMHTINRPNERGESSKVLQHNIKLPTWNARTLALYPDFRLGPEDGSYCDTLGIDNYPVANFRYETETPDLATLYFTDLSYHAPTNWMWDFGDGTLSLEMNVSHTYGHSGIYNVCLTVSNSNGSMTSCKNVFAEKPSGTGNVPITFGLAVLPNPFKDFIKINQNSSEPVDISLFDMEGRTVLHVNMTCPCTIITNNLSPGIYFYVTLTGQKRMTGRLIKI